MREMVVAILFFCISFKNNLMCLVKEVTEAWWEMKSKNTLSGFMKYYYVKRYWELFPQNVAEWWMLEIIN